MPTVRELVEEAEENFQTERFGNSAALFRQASLYTIEQEVISDGIYLVYRALHDFEEAMQPLSKLRYLHQITELLLQYQIKFGSQLMNDESMTDSHLDIMDVIQNAQQKLELTEDREALLNSYINEIELKYTETRDVNYLEKGLKIGYHTKLSRLYLNHSIADAIKQIEYSDFDDGEFVAMSKLIQVLTYVPDIEFNQLQLQPAVIVNLNNYKEPANLQDAIQEILNIIYTLLDGDEAQELTDLFHRLIERYDQKRIIEFI